MKQLPKILFISHDSSLTGAPILLRNLVSLFKSKGQDYCILLMRGGKLEKEFSELGKTYILKPASYQKDRKLPGKLMEFAKFRIRRRAILRVLKQCELIFNNTVTNGAVLHYFKNKPIVTYVHELESVIAQYRESARLTFALSDILVCPSRAVAENLESSHGVPKSKIRFLPYYMPLPARERKVTDSIWDRFAIPPDRFYVVGMGTATSRKGFDLFVETCRKISLIDKGFFFIWIGGFVDVEMKEWFGRLDTRELSTSFLMTGELPHNQSNPAGGNLLFLSSREDPYPLVVIEAAQAAMPSIYFEGSGGIGDFINEETGWRLPKLDTDAVVALLMDLRSRKEEVRLKGVRAKEKARLLHQDDERIYQQCRNMLEEVIKME